MPARYALTEDALIVETDGARLVLGRWDRVFGCWRAEGGALHPARPEGAVLDRRGVWLSPWPGEGAAAVAVYFALIPLAIRRRAAPFGAEQWAELERLWRACRDVTGSDTPAG